MSKSNYMKNWGFINHNKGCHALQGVTAVSAFKTKTCVNSTSNVTDKSDIIIEVFASPGLHMMPPLLRPGDKSRSFFAFTACWVHIEVM